MSNSNFRIVYVRKKKKIHTEINTDNGNADLKSDWRAGKWIVFKEERLLVKEIMEQRTIMTIKVKKITDL